MSKHQWILDGLTKPGKSKVGLAAALRRSPSMVTDLLHGKRKLQLNEIPIVEGYLDVMAPPLAGVVKILGQAGHATDGTVRFAPKNTNFGETPMPLGGSKDTVAVEIVGDSVRGVAQDGSLIYYDNQHKPPAPEMMGELCVVGLADQRVLIKYLHPGRGLGLYDLESASAPTLRDAPVVWAALVTTIIPGPQAKKIIRRASAEPKPRRKPPK